MARADCQIRVRVPEEIRHWAASEASKLRRSMNAQIVCCLEDAMRGSPHQAQKPAAGEASQAQSAAG